MTRTAIVTAAGKGMGRAIARRLAGDGFNLALMSNSGGAEALADELGGVGITGSVTDPDDLSRLVDLTVDKYGTVDAVVNNTGHPPSGPLLELTDEDWTTGLDLVLLNVVRTTRLVTPVMEQNGGGAIVNISTFSAFEPDPSFPISSALRAALAGFALPRPVRPFGDPDEQHPSRVHRELPAQRREPGTNTDGTLRDRR